MGLRDELAMSVYQSPAQHLLTAVAIVAAAVAWLQAYRYAETGTSRFAALRH